VWGAVKHGVLASAKTHFSLCRGETIGRRRHDQTFFTLIFFYVKRKQSKKVRIHDNQLGQRMGKVLAAAL